MRVLPPQEAATSPVLVPLSDVRPGRTVLLLSPAKKPYYYQVCFATSNEPNISDVPGKVMLMNLDTGRIVMKGGHLLVAPLSCTAKTYYHHR